MHFRGLDLNLLVALDALITEKSISRTGEKIHLASPAPAEPLLAFATSSRTIFSFASDARWSLLLSPKNSHSRCVNCWCKPKQLSTAFRTSPLKHRSAASVRRLAQFYAKQLPLKILKPPVEIPPGVESMQWHAIRDGDPGLKWLRRILHSAVAEHPVR
jgi:hypothetical protein